MQEIRDRLVAQRAAAKAQREMDELREAGLRARLRRREENAVLGAFADVAVQLDEDPACESCARGRRMAAVVDDFLAGDASAWDAVG